MLAKDTKKTSSWIKSVGYSGVKDTPGYGFLILIDFDGTGTVYEGVPSYKAGLVQAGVKGSIGKAYHKHIKGQYPYTKLNAEEVGVVVGMFEDAKKVV